MSAVNYEQELLTKKKVMLTVAIFGSTTFHPTAAFRFLRKLSFFIVRARLVPSSIDRIRRIPFSVIAQSGHLLVKRSPRPLEYFFFLSIDLQFIPVERGCGSCRNTRMLFIVAFSLHLASHKLHSSTESLCLQSIT